MERWENRYANGRKGNLHAVEHSRSERSKIVVIILLAVALLGVGIAGGKAIAFRGDAEDLMLARAMTECSSAVNQVNTLSRYGGSDSAVLVGKIRASIHAMDVCNELYASYYGSQVVHQGVFTGLYNTIDSYMAKLKNGTTTMEEQTNLLGDLTALQDLLMAKQ